METYSDPTTGMQLLPVPGGTFEMGDLFGDGFADEQPVHQVTLDPFLMGRFPVTQGQWMKVMGHNPATFTDSPELPVESIRWQDAQDFVARLNALSDGRYSLPSEAQWEYAARSGGLKEKWAGTSDPQQAPDYCWYDENCRKATHPVGLKKPNGLGLHDMSGNVYEFVLDNHSADGYRRHALLNPVYRDDSGERVIRGGAWYTYLLLQRCSDRSIYHETYKDRYVGLRLVRNL